MSDGPRFTDLAGIDMVSGLNERGEAFVQITARDTAGNRMIGQLPPGEVRQHALAYLEAAEAAEYDAIFARFLQEELGLVGLERAARIIADLRKYREGGRK